MAFISEAGQASINEPKAKALSDYQLIDNTIGDIWVEEVDGYESEDDVMVQFGVGGPA